MSRAAVYRHFAADGSLLYELAAVSNASVGGSFPPAWFDVLDEMCRERGIECPRAAFRFRSSESAA